MSRGAQFHEGIASTWTQGYHSGSFLRRLQLFRGLIHGSVQAGSDWMDLGCGSGVLTQVILERQPGRIIAIDGSRSMLEQAKATLGNGLSETRIDWHLADVCNLPFIDSGCLDGVLCSSVIEYLEDPGESIKEMRRALRQGGRLLLSVPISTSFVRRAQQAIRTIGRLAAKDFYPYLEVSRFDIPIGSAGALLKPYGFQVLEQHRFDPVLPVAFQGVLDPALLVIVAAAC